MTVFEQAVEAGALAIEALIEKWGRSIDDADLLTEAALRAALPIVAEAAAKVVEVEGGRWGSHHASSACNTAGAILRSCLSEIMEGK